MNQESEILKAASDQFLYCPICLDSHEFEVICPITLGNSKEYDLVECAVCKTRQFLPIPEIDAIKSFYGARFYGSDWFKQRGWGRTFAQWHLDRKKKGKYLEVGCSLGYFLDGIRSVCDWELHGVEFSDSSVEHAKSVLNLNVQLGELEEVVYPDESFDFIRVCNILEHVRDPRAMLEECRRIVKPDGCLHLSIPNGITDSQSLINFYKAENLSPLSKDGHLFFFPKETLVRMIEESGFKIAKAGTIGIRRGLKALGKYPKRRKWKNPYYARKNIELSSSDCELPIEKKRPNAYYQFRRLSRTIRMFPDLREFGLEFKIFLTPFK